MGKNCKGGNTVDNLDGAGRREVILQRLSAAEGPVSAATLATELGVSRQIIVGDVALLRAAGAPIMATARGYVSAPGAGVSRVLACVHPPEGMEGELNAIVDQGCEVVDVMVEHPLYGQLTGNLGLRSRYDVGQFLLRCAKSEARPLSLLTEGVHFHTIRGEGTAALDRAEGALEKLGFLAR